MQLLLISIGKPNDSYVAEGVTDFTKRISRYYPVSWDIISPLKNAGKLSENDLKKKEAEIILGKIKKEDCLVALDEKGAMLSSVTLSKLIQDKSNSSYKRLIFLIGGAYGLDETVLKRADFKWSLSDLTFPHQLVRLILAEQVYRACSIIKNEKYHHE